MPVSHSELPPEELQNGSESPSDVLPPVISAAIHQGFEAWDKTREQMGSGAPLHNDDLGKPTLPSVTVNNERNQLLQTVVETTVGSITGLQLPRVVPANDGDTAPVPGVKDKPLTTVTNASSSPGNGTWVDSIGKFLTGGTNGTGSPAEFRLPVAQPLANIVAPVLDNASPAPATRPPETKAENIKILPTVLTGSLGDLMGTTVTTVASTVSQVGNIVTQQTPTEKVLPVAVPAPAPVLPKLLDTVQNNASPVPIPNVIQNVAQNVDRVADVIKPAPLANLLENVRPVEPVRPTVESTRPVESARPAENVRPVEILPRIAETISAGPRSEEAVIARPTETTIAAQRAPEVTLAQRMADAVAVQVQRVSDLVLNSNLTEVTSTQRATEVSSVQRAPELTSTQRAPELTSTQRAPELTSTQRAPELVSTQRAPELGSPQRTPELVSTQRNLEPVVAQASVINVLRELAPVASREPIPISLMLARTENSSVAKAEATRVEKTPGTPGVIEAVPINITKLVDKVPFVEGIKSDLSARNEAAIREGTIRGIASVIDINGRTTFDTTGIRLHLGEKQTTTIAMGEPSIKITAAQPISPSHTIFIIPDKKGGRRADETVQDADGDGTPASTTTDPNGIRINPILVNGSNAPTTSTNSTQDPTSTAGGGMLVNVDPAAINAALPTVQICDPDNAPREGNTDKEDLDAQRRLKEQEDRRREEEAKIARERAEQIRREQEEQNRRIQQILLTELATNKTQIMIENEIRRKYIVKEGDTLESIALIQLGDAHLGLLIYRVNKLAIKTKYEEGKQIPQLRTGMTLYLPNNTDIVIFRENVHSDRIYQPSQTAKDKAWDRLFGILGSAPPGARLRYTVKLGDCITTLAARHPALHDVSLWQLIAEINNLSTDTDAGGKPLVILRRGSILVLPTVQEISDFRARGAKQADPQMIAC